MFVAALRRAATRPPRPPHEIVGRLPRSGGLGRCHDVVVISDVGANSFQLTDRNVHGVDPSPDKSELIRRTSSEAQPC